MLTELNITQSIANLSVIRTKSNIPKNCKIKWSRLSGEISIGAHVAINRSDISGPVEIGAFTSINGPNTNIYAFINSIKIGKFCSIARGVQIQEYNHNIDAFSTYSINYKIRGLDRKLDYVSKGNIEIGNDVWIGANSIIMSGVEIGSGAVIGAGSVVTKSVPPYSVAAGNPAKVIKYRFDRDVRERMLRSEWWNKPKAEIADMKLSDF